MKTRISGGWMDVLIDRAGRFTHCRDARLRVSVVDGNLRFEVFADGRLVESETVGLDEIMGMMGDLRRAVKYLAEREGR